MSIAKINTLTMHGQIARYDGVSKLINDGIAELNEISEKQDANIANIRNELKTGYKMEVLKESDYTIGYVGTGSGNPSASIRGIYTPLLPEGYTISVEGTGIKVARYRYNMDETYKSGTVVESVALPASTIAGEKVRFLAYWADTGLFTNVTEARARELFAHVTVSTSTAKTDLLGYNENIARIDSTVSDMYDKRTVNASAYVVGRAISYKRDSNCDLLITNDIVLSMYGVSSAIRLTPEQLRALAEASDLTTVRSDGSIRGNEFCIVYDLEDSSWKIIKNNVGAMHARYINVFGQYWSSRKTGLIVDALTDYRFYEMGNDIAALSNDIAALQARAEDPLLPVIPTYFATEVNDTIRSIKAAATEPCYAVLFVTDSHHAGHDWYGDGVDMENWDVTAPNIKYLSRKYQMDAIIHGGDLTNGYAAKATTLGWVDDIRNDLFAANPNTHILIGNHDDNTYKDTTTNRLSSGELYANYQRGAAPMVHSDGNGSYYYDVDGIGLRVICLNSIIGIGNNTANWGYTDAQLAWFRDTALDTDHQVAIFSHMPFTPSFVQSGAMVNGVNMRNVVNAFISGGGVVAGLFHGHTHWDYIGKASGSALTECSTGCSGFRVSDKTPISGATVQARMRGNKTEDLWDCIVIKPMSRQVNIIRFGAGDDRTFSY